MHGRLPSPEKLPPENLTIQDVTLGIVFVAADCPECGWQTQPMRETWDYLAAKHGASTEITDLAWRFTCRCGAKGCEWMIAYAADGPSPFR
jgi:hypothetical protein